MASGYPDWRPPGSGAGGRTIALVVLAAAGDIIPAPGAGFRIVLFDFMTIPSAAGAGGTFAEVTPANVLVRNLLDLVSVANGFIPYPFAGLPFAPGNKFRLTGSGGATWHIHITYVLEAV